MTGEGNEVRGPAPRANDLTRIKGIGPAIQAQLNKEGIYTFADLAVLTTERLAELDALYGWKGRPENNDWRTQATVMLTSFAPPVCQMKPPRRLDESRPYGTISPSWKGALYEQDGVFFNGEKVEISL